MFSEGSESSVREIVIWIMKLIFCGFFGLLQYTTQRTWVSFVYGCSACERESNDFDDYENTIVSVAVAALTLSFRTKLYLKVPTLNS